MTATYVMVGLLSTFHGWVCPICHFIIIITMHMHMFIMCYHGEIMWQEFSGTSATHHCIDHAGGSGKPDRSLSEKALGHEKLLFRERTLKTSKFIVGSSFSRPATKLVTELTVYILRSRARLWGVQLQYGNDLVRGVAMTRAQLRLIIQDTYVQYYYYTTVP